MNWLNYIRRRFHEEFSTPDITKNLKDDLYSVMKDCETNKHRLTEIEIDLANLKRHVKYLTP